MYIAIQKGRAIVLALVVAAASLFMMSVAPAPKAQAATGANIINLAITFPGRPCTNFEPGPITQGDVMKTVREIQAFAYNRMNDWEAKLVAAISIVSYCPWLADAAAPWVGFPIGNWMNPGTTREEQSLHIALRNGATACSIANSSGMRAALDFLGVQRPDVIAYPTIPNDAFAGMAISALVFCPWQLGALGAQLGG